MAKILLFASGALLLASAFLGFKNLSRLRDQQDRVKEAVQTAKTSQDRADKAGRDLKSSQQQLEAASKGAAELQEKLAAATQESDRLRRDSEDNQRKIAEAQTQVTALQQQATTGSAQPKFDPTFEAGQKMRELEARIAELDQVRKTLDEQVKAADANVRQLQRREQQRQAGLMTAGLSGTILAVDNNWNFVVLNLGDRNGVVNNAEMVVTRGGSTVGKVRITSVEPSQSIADIVPNSVPPGVSVQRGDRVIYASGGEPPGAVGGPARR